MNQQAGAWALRVIRRQRLEGVDNGALFLTHVLLEAAQFAEAIDNNKARLH